MKNSPLSACCQAPVVPCKCGKYCCSKCCVDCDLYDSPERLADAQSVEENNPQFDPKVVFLLNRVLIEYGKALSNSPWEGKYPSPFEKSQNDLFEYFSQMITRAVEEERERIKEIVNSMKGRNIKYDVLREIDLLTQPQGEK